MSRITILGAGMVGRAIAVDLSKQHKVTSVDLNPESLAPLSGIGIKTLQGDLSDSSVIRKVIQDTDLVVGCVPGFLGFNMLRTVIGEKKNIVDISFFPEDAFELDKLAKENKVIAVTDVGVAPGMSNIIYGYHYDRMKVVSFECMVGGLPVVRTWPYEYKAPFSPIDVIEEYTRPARFIRDGKLVTKEALTDPELISFKGIGTLEAFNSDGLRSLIKTMPCENMIERTLRYPGHIEYMRVLRETGFFSQELMEVKGVKVKPIDITAKLLFPKWKLQEGERELTVMQIKIKGIAGGQEKTYVYDLLDYYHAETKTSSMARTTGYTCTAAAELILKGLYASTGISPAELVGKDEKCFQFVLKYLSDRGVYYEMTETNS